MNNYEVSLRACLSYVRKLDLSESQLDVNHDFLTLIPELVQLRVLTLADLALTDRGLKKVLLPCFDARRLPHLTYLDISGTGFTAKLLSSLKRMTQLQQLLLYCEEENLPLDRMREALAPWFRLAGRPDVERISTTGFGSGLPDRWGEVLARASKRRRDASVSRPAFYGLLQAVDMNDTRPILERPLRRNKVVFCPTGKRTADVSGSNPFQQRKRLKTETVVEKDQTDSGILNLYI